jgi:hypothetical protein
VHVPLRRREILVAGELLNGSGRRAAHRQMRTERVPQPMHTALRYLRPSRHPFNMVLDDVCGQR